MKLGHEEESSLDSIHLMATMAELPPEQGPDSHQRSGSGARRSSQQSRSYRDYGSSSDWTKYSFVHLVVTDLPPASTTLDIYNNFQKYGHVSRIAIFDRRQGDWSTRGEVYFEPPPEYPIWLRGRINFQAANGTTKWVGLKLSAFQPKSFKVESPVHRGVMYNDKTELLASSLTWGVMTKPLTMMTMATTPQKTDEKVSVILNLHRREIEIFFPFVFRSDKSVAVRSWRFLVALDDEFTIWKLPGKTYVLHLSNIPWYSKQLKEAVAQTHSSHAKRWSEEDTWARQTDLFSHKNMYEVINNSHVSLQKTFNSINIARWTTFKIDLVEEKENALTERLFRNALRDFNIHVRDCNDFEFVEAEPKLDHRVWSMLGGNHNRDKPLSLAEELARIELPFAVRYQLEVCISHGWISEYTITPEFLQALASTEESKAKQMLLYVDSYEQRVWDPMDIFRDLRYRRPVRRRQLPDNCMEVHSVTVTATSLIWNSPTVEVTNRVIRKYKHYATRFLRVHFEDDAYRGQSRLYASSNNKMILIFHRVKRALMHGIRLGSIHYDFLAWGNSQLRDHGVYFFAKTDNLSASKIRAEMGAFDREKVVAKRAARMGQCFSTTKPVDLKLPTITDANLIADITCGPYTFTDGVGKISPLAAQIAHQQLRIKGPVPSTFQFRLGGCKGVLTVWPELVGIDVQVRASQFKFNSSSGELEIIRWSEFWQPFLNRQIILCLSSLGVPDQTFMTKQDETIKLIQDAMEDDKAAVKALRDNIDPNMMTPSIVNLVHAGFRARKEPFVTSILHLWKAWSLKYLKEKAKIPVRKGAFILGVVDETNTLRGHFDRLVPDPNATRAEKIKSLPEIFIQATDPQTGQRKIIEGVCILARNPSLHQGDIRIVKAVNNPLLRHLCDVVVMPANGDRDLASMCSGGDLDGDDYMVIWDEDLIPQVWNTKPFDYTPPPPKMATGEITTNDIINFFFDYLQNDYLGRIAHAHLAAGDFLDEGIESQTCEELVNLHSTAVDYPKTGIPAIMERRLERNTWPHFMEKKGQSYKSHKVLGRLYDAVERVAFKPTHDSPFDERILRAGKADEQTFESIKNLKQDYDNALQRIMAQHNIKTEFEVWSTFVLIHSKASRDYKFHEEIGRLSSALKDEYHEALCNVAGGRDFEHLKIVAIAAYQYTHAMVQTAQYEINQGVRQNGPEGMPFISFPWVLQDTLCKIASQADDLIVKHGSTAVVRDGNLQDITHISEFDEQGRAQIRLRDAFDVEIEAPAASSHHLSDPYIQPPMEQPVDHLGDSHFNNQDCNDIEEVNNFRILQVKDEPKIENEAGDGIKDEVKNVIGNSLIPISTEDQPDFFQPSSSLIDIEGDDQHGHVSAPISPQAPLNLSPFLHSPNRTHWTELAGLTDHYKSLNPVNEEINPSEPQSSAGTISTTAPTRVSAVIPLTSKIRSSSPLPAPEPAPTIEDPYDMTAEQLQAMGLPDDMEL